MIFLTEQTLIKCCLGIHCLPKYLFARANTDEMLFGYSLLAKVPVCKYSE